MCGKWGHIGQVIGWGEARPCVVQEERLSVVSACVSRDQVQGQWQWRLVID